MTQSKSDLDFLNGLHLMIDSIESSQLQKADDDDDGEVKHQLHIQNVADDDLPEANHWCPDVQAWHTVDHGPAQAPSVHVNVDSNGGDAPYQSENAVDSSENESITGAWNDADRVEKVASLASSVASAAAPVVGAAIGEKIGSKIKGEKDVTKGDPDKPDFTRKHGDITVTSPSGKKTVIPSKDLPGAINDPRDDPDRTDPRVEKGEYDQNTNLDRETQENSESSVAEPFLNRYATNEEEEQEEDENESVEKAEMSFDKSIDILKIWGSVDRVLPKTELDIDLVDDISILKSFELDETTNIEELVEGTLVYKMLVDRANRPTSDWWESSMSIAKTIDNVDEPAFLSAYLYYDPDTFELGDFINLEKAEVTRGKPQDLEMMPNTSGGSAMDGLGMSADGHHGPEDDKDCD